MIALTSAQCSAVHPSIAEIGMTSPQVLGRIAGNGWLTLRATGTVFRLLGLIVGPPGLAQGLRLFGAGRLCSDPRLYTRACGAQRAAVAGADTVAQEALTFAKAPTRLGGTEAVGRLERSGGTRHRMNMSAPNSVQAEYFPDTRSSGVTIGQLASGIFCVASDIGGRNHC